MPAPGEDIYSWSITAALNSTADGSINWQEGQARRTVNDSARSMMAAQAKSRILSTGIISTGGSPNAQSFTSGVGYTTIPAGMRVLLKTGVGPNTGPTTLDMDSIGPLEIKKKTTGHPSLVAGELVLFGFYEFYYDGVNWLLLDAISETDINGKVDIAGDTMTGPLTINGLLTANDGLTCLTNIQTATLVAASNITTPEIILNGNMEVSLGGILIGPLVQGLGYATRSGLPGPPGGSYFNFQWGGGALTAWIDAINVGLVTLTSDYRIKKDVQSLSSMWDTVKALRPIKYTQAEFSPMFHADDIERWGFIAHELQETLIASAASGVKDQENLIQSPNPFTLIAALTKALQEAMARIEALEVAWSLSQSR